MSTQDLITESINSILSFFRVPDGAGGFFTVTQQEVIDTLSLATVPKSLNVVYTGKLPASFPPVIQVDLTGGQADIMGHSGDTAIAPFTGVCTQTTFTFADPLNGLTSLTFGNLAGIMGTSSFSALNLSAVTALSFPVLAYVGGSFNPSSIANLTTLSLPLLVYVGGVFGPGTMANLTTLSLPALTYVGGSFNCISMASLTTLSLPALTYVGSTFSPSTMASLTTVSLPSLTYMGGNFSPSTMASLTTVSIPAVTFFGNAITLTSGLGGLASVTLGRVGTLKSIVGSTINISGQKLDQASVNGLLALLVSLDGTNGTTLWGTGKTVNLSGGTSAAPSGQGIIDAAALVTRGATVITN